MGLVYLRKTYDRICVGYKFSEFLVKPLPRRHPTNSQKRGFVF